MDEVVLHRLDESWGGLLVVGKNPANISRGKFLDTYVTYGGG